jgi:AraC family transcriptional regulator of adaptative response / DNA-3-methyladenine glycosylase II
VASGTDLCLQLPFRPPFDWGSAVEFLRPQATPGVEQVKDGVYKRTIRVDGVAGRIEIAPDPSAHSLRLRVDLPDWRSLGRIVQRARRVFDLEADPMEIAGHLATDPLLAHRLALHPGLRVVGSFDGFELTVRAILGQRLSVECATAWAGLLAERFGERLRGLDGEGPDLVFPTAETLANADLRDAGLPARRAEAIVRTARAVARGDLRFDEPQDLRTIVRQITRIPGVGHWTAQYVAMRAFGEPDALPATDTDLQRAAGNGNGTLTASQFQRRAESWRPWRSYAAMHLWTP